MNAPLRKISTTILALALGIVLSATAALAASVEIKSKDGLGNYLTDEKGMALYMFKNDTAGKSVCNGPCEEKWPVFYVENIVAPEGVAKEDFGVITRDDGTMQTTYKGMPLYYFFKDKDAEDVYGQGVKDVWFVVAP